MARISLDPPQTRGYRLGSRLARCRYGVRLDPGAAIDHNAQVGRSYAILDLQMVRWRQLDFGLKDLAAMAAAAAGRKDRCELCAADDPVRSEPGSRPGAP